MQTIQLTVTLDSNMIKDSKRLQEIISEISLLKGVSSVNQNAEYDLDRSIAKNLARQDIRMRISSIMLAC